MELDPKTSAARRRALAPVEILGRAELFEGLEPADLNEIAGAMAPREFEPGDELCREGEQAERHARDRGRPRPRARRPAGRCAKRRHGEVIGAAKLVAAEPHARDGRGPDTDPGAGARRPRVPRRGRPLSARSSRTWPRSWAGASPRSSSARRDGTTAARRWRSWSARRCTARSADIVAAAAAASPRPVDSVDTVVSLQDTLATLDDRLAGHGTVILVAGLRQETLPLVLEHADRAVALRRRPRGGQARAGPRRRGPHGGAGPAVGLAGDGRRRARHAAPGGGRRRASVRGRGRLGGPSPGPHEAGARPRRRRREGLRAPGRAPGPRGGRLPRRRRVRREHRRDRGHLRRARAWTPPRSRTTLRAQFTPETCRGGVLAVTGGRLDRPGGRDSPDAGARWRPDVRST